MQPKAPYEVSSQCRECGLVFTYLKSGRGRLKRFCSPECKTERQRKQQEEGKARLAAGIRLYTMSGRPRKAYVRTKKPRSPRTVTIICAWCRQEAQRGYRPKALVQCCSEKCRSEYYKAQNRAKTGAKYGVDELKLERRACEACGTEFQQIRNNQRFCCRTCSNRSRYPDMRRRRRAHLGAARYKVNPFTVFERDGWRCQICRVKTPRRLRGTQKPNAPVLDHIVPLSQGGEHSYENSQCACHSCNTKKATRTLGQLHLFPAG